MCERVKKKRVRVSAGEESACESIAWKAESVEET